MTSKRIPLVTKAKKSVFKYSDGKDIPYFIFQVGGY